MNQAPAHIARRFEVSRVFVYEVKKRFEKEGKRCLASAPHEHWHTNTFVAILDEVRSEECKNFFTASGYGGNLV